MPGRERESFLTIWELEAKNTVRLLDALPPDRYDFRPHPDVHSLGELAWHLAQAEDFFSLGAEQGRFDLGARPAGRERPQDIPGIAAGYRRVHEEAMARVRKLGDEDFDRRVPFFGNPAMRLGDILWGALLHHVIHHRGQLVLLCRLAGGRPPGMYGPSREEMAAMKGRQG